MVKLSIRPWPLKGLLLMPPSGIAEAMPGYKSPVQRPDPCQIWPHEQVMTEMTE